MGSPQQSHGQEMASGGRRRGRDPPPTCRLCPRPFSISAPAAADAHGEVKVNFWEAPTEVAKWKEEHVSTALLLRRASSCLGKLLVLNSRGAA